MTELNHLWTEIHNRLPDIQAVITGSTPPPDGMPGTPSNPRRLPCNEHAFSLEEQITRRAGAWAATDPNWTGIQTPTIWLACTADQLMTNLGPEDQLSFQTETITLHNEAKQYEPASVKIRALTGKDLDRVHCATLKELQAQLATLGHNIPTNTLKSWRQRGHLPKTGHGYPLTNALTKARASS